MSHAGGDSRLLSGALIGFCLSSVGFLALYPFVSKPSQVPPIIVEKTIAEEKIVYAGVTVVPPGGSRRVKKLYTARIEPVLAAISREKRALETQQPVAQMKVRPARGPDSCKPGRTRNAKGLCGRWTTLKASKTVTVKGPGSR